MFIFCLFAVTLAEKAVIFDLNLNRDKLFCDLQYETGNYDICNALYLKYDMDKCLYISETESRKYVYKDNKVTQYNYVNGKCEGNYTTGLDESILTKYYKDVPAFNGYKTYYSDDDKCSHEKTMPKVYYKTGCNKVRGYVGDARGDLYIEFYELFGTYYFNTFYDEKCVNEISINGQKYKSPVWECDKCSEKYKTFCGSVPTMILALLIIVAFFF